ncbi:MAG: hypothetical protein ACD_68C00035G0005 [uncultured bacterium]|nr:MAG: hypothetical protein ACD_68C00035G0005 [uncultured bacterium]
MYKTFQPRGSKTKRHWHLVDLAEQNIGKSASKIAFWLQGKHKATFANHLDQGDFVVVINIEKLRLSQKKLIQKKYFHYSGYPGGIKNATQKELWEKDPKNVVKKAVYNMLPANRLRSDRLKRLYLYLDDKHPYQEKFKK